MRKQTKIAAVVSAAALLALGASITSFAAVKGTWKMEDGEWYCYDKNGDVIENEFCVSNGKDYYVGDNGLLVRSDWVEDDEYYFVNSAGEKIVNDWRLATPYDDDDAEEAWYYFQSSGKMAKNKKLVIKGNTYYFGDDGKMLTGWVNAEDDTVEEAGAFDKDNTYYCDEETGARLTKAWIYTTEPGVDEDDDEDEFYYYLKSNGNPAVGKTNNISGQTYFFDKDGHMLSGWVVATGAKADEYEEVGGEDSTYVISSTDKVYFCGDSDDGHMKKNKWIKLWKPEQYDEADEDNGKKWYWIQNNGQIFVPASTSNAIKYAFEDGQLKNDGSDEVAEKSVNSKKYYFNDEGQMVKGFNAIEGTMFYFGGSDDGSMKTGSQSINDDCDEAYRFYFETSSSDSKTKGAGITGVKSGKLYCDGMLIKAEDAKYEIVELPDGRQYIVNQSGSVQTSKNEYKEDGENVFGEKVTFTYNKDDSIVEEVSDPDIIAANYVYSTK